MVIRTLHVFWDTPTAVLRGIFIILKAYIGKEERLKKNKVEV